MKKLLITSAIVAFAGVAAAEVTWTGDAEFGWKSYYNTKAENAKAKAEGFNDVDVFAETTDANGHGLYVDAGLNAKASAELDNGITASIDYGMNFDYAAEGKSNFVTLDNFPTLIFESSVGKMTVGEVDHAAHAMFAGPDAMDVKFTENEDELVSRVDAMMSGFAIGGSYTITDQDKDKKSFGDIGLPTNSFTLGGKGEIAGALMSFGYEWDDVARHEVYGATAGYTWNGIRGVLAYTTDNAKPKNQYSLGLTAGYTMQNGLDIAFGIADRGVSMGYSLDLKFNAMGADVKLGYEMTSADDDMWKKDDVITADIAYEIASAGVTVKAGYDSGEWNVIDDNKDGAFYAGAEYGLGNGASVFAAYSTGDEIGDAKYDAGASLGVKLSF